MAARAAPGGCGLSLNAWLGAAFP